MRNANCSAETIDSILSGLKQRVSSDLDEPLVPEWLVERLRHLHVAVENEPLPENIVTLLRQLKDM